MNDSAPIPAGWLARGRGESWIGPFNLLVERSTDAGIDTYVVSQSGRYVDALIRDHGADVAAVLASVQRAAFDRIERRADASASTDPRAWRGWRRGDGWHLGEPREIRAVLDRDGVNRGDVVCARGAPYEHIYSEADALIRKLTR